MGEMDWVVTTPCPTEPPELVRGTEETDAAWQKRQRDDASERARVQLEHRRWVLDNKKCLALVKNTIEPAIMGSIQNEDTVKGYLQRVENQFTGSSKTYATQMIRQLVNEKYTGGGIREHILKMNSLATKLKTVNLTIQEDLLVHFVLLSLPPQFDNFVSNYDMNPEKWTFE